MLVQFFYEKTTEGFVSSIFQFISTQTVNVTVCKHEEHITIQIFINEDIYSVRGTCSVQIREGNKEK